MHNWLKGPPKWLDNLDDRMVFCLVLLTISGWVFVAIEVATHLKGYH